MQNTGFPIPTGEGLFAFSTLDEAAEAVERLVSDPHRHARAAREIAAEHSDSDRVLTKLTEEALKRPDPPLANENSLAYEYNAFGG